MHFVYLLRHAAHRKTNVSPAVAEPSRAVTVDIQAARLVTVVALCATPVVADSAYSVDISIGTVACGRQENRITGNFVGKFSTGYAVYDCPFVTHFVLVQQRSNFTISRHTPSVRAGVVDFCPSINAYKTT